MIALAFSQAEREQTELGIAKCRARTIGAVSYLGAMALPPMSGRSETFDAKAVVAARDFLRENCMRCGQCDLGKPAAAVPMKAA